MKYKILFIDEEKDQHDNFLDYMDKIEDKVEVKCLYPEENIEAMIQVFEDEHPDAIVTDHQLNEIKSTTYRIMEQSLSMLIGIYVRTSLALSLHHMITMPFLHRKM